MRCLPLMLCLCFLRLLTKYFNILSGGLQQNHNSKAAKCSLHIHVQMKTFTVNDDPTTKKCCITESIFSQLAAISLSRKILKLSAYSNILNNSTQSACFSSSLNEPHMSSVPWFFLSTLESPHALRTRYIHV